jgi:hypothetical protein
VTTPTQQEAAFYAKIEAMDPMTRQYLVTALWAELDQSDPNTGGDPLDKNCCLNDFDPKTVDAAISDCADFRRRAGGLLDGLDLSTVGHDFWLTRQGHGAGFWDGDYKEEIGQALTKLSKEFGEIGEIYAQDGAVYIR